MKNDERRYWLDEPRNVKKIVYALFVLCAGLIAADLFVHHHGHFAFEEWFGFFGFYGFFSCVGLVLAAKGLRVLIKRREDYYSRESLDAWGQSTGWGVESDPDSPEEEGRFEAEEPKPNRREGGRHA